MKYIIFVITIIINLAGFALLSKANMGGFSLLVVPVLSILAGIVIIQTNADEAKKNSGWWVLWGMFASFPIGVLILFVLMSGHC